LVTAWCTQNGLTPRGQVACQEKSTQITAIANCSNSYSELAEGGSQRVYLYRGDFDWIFRQVDGGK
jgi:hypothetical protein